MSFVPCALEVRLDGKKVKASIQETGLLFKSNQIQVIGAMNNVVLRQGSIASVAAPLAHEGKLTCIMKSGTMLILSQLDRSQTHQILTQFHNFKIPIAGLKKAVPNEARQKAPAPCRVAGNQPASSSRKRPREEEPVCKAGGLSLVDLPMDVFECIQSYCTITHFCKRWTQYRRDKVSKMSVNGQGASVLTGNSVVQFMRHRTCLKDAEIIGVCLLGPQLKSLPKVMPHLINLQRLILRKCVNITDSGLSQLLKASPQLLVLDVMECPKISAAGFEQCVAPLTRLACGNFKTNSARFNDCMFNKKMKLTHLALYNGSALRGMAMDWFPLIYCDVRSCELDDEAAVKLARISTLCELNISGNSKITDVGVSGILSGCRKLEVLDISYLAVDFGNFTACKALKKLKISFCREIRDGEEVAKSQVHAFRLMEILPSLVQIDVSHVELGPYPIRVLSPEFKTISGLDERDNIETSKTEFLREMAQKGVNNVQVYTSMRTLFRDDLIPFPLE